MIDQRQSARTTAGSNHSERKGIRMTRLMRWTLTAATILAVALMSVITWHSTRWIGRTFPGFFVMANRVVPSSSLPGWEPAASAMFQHQVVAVDGVAVQSAPSVYEQVDRVAPDTSVRYTLRAPDGTVTTGVIRARRVSLTDYVLLFGAFLFCGSVFIGTALIVAWSKPDGAATPALLSAFLGVGIYSITAADLYGPSWFFRLHALAEALFPAGVFHLALVFPVDRLREMRRPMLVSVYVPFVFRAILSQVVLYWPSAYTIAHLVAVVGHGLCCVAIVGAVLRARLTTDSPRLRRQIGFVGAGAMVAFAGPVLLNCTSGFLAGFVPVNATALTAFIFPLSLGYAMITGQRLGGDLFGKGIGPHQPSGQLGTLLRRLAAPVRRAATWIESPAGQRRARGYAVGGGVLAVALITVVSINSLQWVGTTFPGFFLMRNHVIPSIALPDWQASAAPLFQHEVLTVNGERFDSAVAAYDRVRAFPVGHEIQYAVRGPDGTTSNAVVASRRFSETDYASLFGAFLFTGSAFLLTGLLVFYLRPDSAGGQGLLSAGVIGGVFVITAVDLYGPHWFFRLHVLAESMVPAGLMHLALVFPTNRLRRGQGSLLMGAYLACAVLAIGYQVALYYPVAYSAAHLVATTAQAVGGLTLIWTITYDLLTTQAEIVRRRVLVAGLGTLAAFLLPTALMGLSGLNDGHVAVNAAALTGFLFPLSFGYAIARNDLLKVDLFLARAAAILISLGVATYAVTAHRLSYLVARWH